MKAWISLRVLSVMLALFCLGHTLGTAAPRVKRGAPEVAVFAAMQDFRFPIMGFERSHWDFYRGFALVISLLLLVLAVIAWQLAALGRRAPREALPMAITLQLCCLGLLVLAWLFFFGAPILMSVIATLVSTIAVVFLTRATTGKGGAPASK